MATNETETKATRTRKIGLSFDLDTGVATFTELAGQKRSREYDIKEMMDDPALWDQLDDGIKFFSGRGMSETLRNRFAAGSANWTADVDSKWEAFKNGDFGREVGPNRRDLANALIAVAKKADPNAKLEYDATYAKVAAMSVEARTALKEGDTAYNNGEFPFAVAVQSAYADIQLAKAQERTRKLRQSAKDVDMSGLMALMRPDESGALKPVPSTDSDAPKSDAA